MKPHNSDGRRIVPVLYKHPSPLRPVLGALFSLVPSGPAPTAGSLPQVNPTFSHQGGAATGAFLSESLPSCEIPAPPQVSCSPHPP